MPKLTQANYQSRKIKLTEHLIAARNAHSDVGMKRELDMATDAEVEIAKKAVDTLQDRLEALDHAWIRTQDEDRVAAEAAEAQGAAADHRFILEQVKKRSALGEELERAATALTDAYRDYQATGEQVIAVALRHQKRFGRDGLQNLRHLVAGEFVDVRPALGRKLAREGLNLDGHTAIGFDTDNAHTRDIGVYVSWQGERIKQGVAALIEPK